MLDCDPTQLSVAADSAQAESQGDVLGVCSPAQRSEPQPPRGEQQSLDIERPRRAGEGEPWSGAPLAQLRSSNQETVRASGANGVGADGFRVLAQELHGALR